MIVKHAFLIDPFFLKPYVRPMFQPHRYKSIDMHYTSVDWFLSDDYTLEDDLVVDS